MSDFFSPDDSFPVISDSDILNIFSPSALDDALPLTPVDTKSNIRKRQRDDSGKANVAPNKSTSFLLAKDLTSDNPNDVFRALNFLLQNTADHDANFSLGQGGHKVIDALVALFDEMIGWTHGNSKWFNDEHEMKDLNLKPSAETWVCRAKFYASPDRPLENANWQSFCATRFAPATLNTSMTPSHIPSFNMLNDENDRVGMKIIEAIIMIVRNLSYVQENIRFILYSVGTFRILIGSLYFRNFYTGKELRGTKNDREESEQNLGNSSNNICLYAIGAFHNLVPFMDITGYKVFLDVYLLDANVDVEKSQTKAARYAESVDIKSVVHAKSYGLIQGMGLAGMLLARNYNAKDEGLTKLPDELFQHAVKNYVCSYLELFPTLFGILKVRTSRAVVVHGLEMMILLIDNPDNREVFLCTPDTILAQLIHLLWIPRLGPDSLEYIDPIINSVSRVSSMRLLGGYDMSVDYEVRDRSVELLQKITELSDDLKRRAGQKIVISQSDTFSVDVAKTTNVPCTILYDAIIPMLTTKTGREHTPLFAAKLLAQLASVEENQKGIMYLERKIIHATTLAQKEVTQILVKDVLQKLNT
mmetsp:Transcript_9295/g.17504  ORF Transcript_9295/g.17504 Transcript_9295/m.17504 type:complete len:588 (+) Transcript_9295:56-1819(+)